MLRVLTRRRYAATSYDVANHDATSDDVSQEKSYGAPMFRREDRTSCDVPRSGVMSCDETSCDVESCNVTS